MTKKSWKYCKLNFLLEKKLKVSGKVPFFIIYEWKSGLIASLWICTMPSYNIPKCSK